MAEGHHGERNTGEVEDTVTGNQNTGGGTWWEGFRKKCPVCGKSFWCNAMWAYKLIENKHLVYLCTWKCLRTREKENEEKEAERRRRIDNWM